MSTATTVRLTEQADRTATGFIYSWLLDAPFRAAKHLPGWKWIRGKPGYFATNDQRLAAETAARLGLTPESNGSHNAVNAPPCL